MALSIVIQRLVSRSSLVLASLEQHLPAAVASVDQELKPYLRAGEFLDEKQVQLFFSLMLRSYQDKRKALEQADTHYNDEQADDDAIRQSGGELTERAFNTLQALRDNLSSHYTRDFLKTLQLTGRMPRTIAGQKALLHFLVNWFGNNNNALPANSANLFATTPEKGKILSILRPLHDELDTFEKKAARETRETQQARHNKAVTTESFQQLESSLLDVSLGLYEWAGLKHEADRLVPPLQRRRSSNTTEETLTDTPTEEPAPVTAE